MDKSKKQQIDNTLQACYRMFSLNQEMDKLAQLVADPDLIASISETRYRLSSLEQFCYDQQELVTDSPS